MFYIDIFHQQIHENSKNMPFYYRFHLCFSSKYIDRYSSNLIILSKYFRKYFLLLINSYICIFLSFLSISTSYYSRHHRKDKWGDIGYSLRSRFTWEMWRAKISYLVSDDVFGLVEEHNWKRWNLHVKSVQSRNVLCLIEKMTYSDIQSQLTIERLLERKWI